ncbi:MAG: hypothetical protein P4M08_14085 [Oligoflexia bacterium]|nr:hypothetical protein [Oligoflexia bacterium]
MSQVKLAVLIAILSLSGCSGISTKAERNPSPILVGEWHGELAVPQDFSSNRGMLDQACDREETGTNLGLKIRAGSSKNTIQVEGHVHCSIHAKRIYSYNLPATSLDVSGQDLLSNGVKVGTLTDVYFSLNTNDGKITVVKYPTWEKIYFEAANPKGETIALSGVFADPNNFADADSGTTPPTMRAPANTRAH